jgi:uncharacterized protein YndB with AHSA1/START domain
VGVRVELEVEIARPRAEVFDYLARGENMPGWMSEFQSVEQLSDGPPGLGTTYRYRLKRPRRASTIEWVEFEQGRRLAFAGGRIRAGFGSLAPGGSLTLQDAGGGATRVAAVYEPRLGGVMRLMGSLVAASIRSGRTNDLRRLKEILEQGPGT